MEKGKKARTAFTEWVDGAPPPERFPLPLTHVAKGIIAHDVIASGQIEPRDCPIFKQALAYFFYGRPAYRYSAEGVVKLEASCPFCFVFDGSLLTFASAIYPFDTGAFAKRMYNHVIDDEFNVEDFCLGSDPERPERLINTTYLTRDDYISGNRTRTRKTEEVTKAHELAARSYLELIKSPGRNEPDDRIGTIEVHFEQPVEIANSLLAVVVPHTHWMDTYKSPFLLPLTKANVDIIPYEFIPGRPLEHYHTLLEVEIKKYCSDKRLF